MVLGSINVNLDFNGEVIKSLFGEDGGRKVNGPVSDHDLNSSFPF